MADEPALTDSEDLETRPPTLLGRLVGALPDLRQRPLRAVLLLLTLGGLLVGLPGLGIWWFGTAGEPPVTVEDALQKLAAGETQQARQMAVLLKARQSVPYAQRSVLAYVIGAAISEDAEATSDPADRHALLMIAARYLEEAYDRGLPDDLRGRGTFLYGKCLNDCHRFAESWEVLQAALDGPYPDKTEIHRLLARAGLYDDATSAAEAMQHIDAYLAAPDLAPGSRDSGLMDKARIGIKARDFEAARAVLDSVSRDGVQRSDNLVLIGQLILLQAEMLRESLPPGDGETERLMQFKYHQAVEVLESVLARDEAGSETSRQSQYLMGIAFRHLPGYEQAALEQFSRVRRGNEQSLEAHAAGLHEAELLQQLNQQEEALAAYQRFVAETGHIIPYFNPWLPWQELRNRLDEAWRGYVKAEDFEHALRMTRLLPPVFQEVEATERKALTHRVWAEQLRSTLSEVTDQQQRDQLDAEARDNFRQAGRYYGLVAQGHTTQRQYPDDLWKSIECYLAAPDYIQAMEALRRYLRENLQQRRPLALVAMGQMQITLGDLEGALRVLKECMDQFPRHPETYQARLLAAKAQLELGRSDDARQSLLLNLQHDALTPRSAEWRDSLFLLGELMFHDAQRLEAKSRNSGVDGSYEEGRRKGLEILQDAYHAYHDAIVKMSQAVQRYADDPRTILTRYRIGEAHRQAAKLPRKQLLTVKIEATRIALNQQIQTELQAALKQYDYLLPVLVTRQENGELDAVSAAILRNCHFARADALYDLGRFEDAIRAYSTATNRYLDHPAALEAFVQMASCYRQLNRLSEARGQLEQAKVVLSRIPQDVDFRLTTRYGREEWKQFLDWFSAL